MSDETFREVRAKEAEGSETAIATADSQLLGETPLTDAALKAHHVDLFSEKFCRSLERALASEREKRSFNQRHHEIETDTLRERVAALEADKKRLEKIVADYELLFGPMDGTPPTRELPPEETGTP